LLEVDLAVDLAIAGKTALVTGASIGIGHGIALALAGEGVKLAITARRSELLGETAAEIVRRGGEKPAIIACDFMREDVPRTIARAATEVLGTIDVLINNAGGSRRFARCGCADR
jgi:3-oxoacyl-[acyl-carrier protein] reductase